jgi:hypothetical protein
MRHRAFVLVVVAGLAAGGCANAAGGTPSASATAHPAAPTHPTARASAPVYGPRGLDSACAAALKAQQTLQARQGRDQGNESALDRDFTGFASALTAAAGRETNPLAAKAMTALANDYTALVESQSGTAQLPSMNTVEKDGTAFARAC